MDRVVSLMTGGGIVGAIVVGVASLCLLIWFLLRDQHEDQEPIPPEPHNSRYVLPNWEFELWEDYRHLEDLLGYLEEYYDKGIWNESSKEEVIEERGSEEYIEEDEGEEEVPPRYANFTPKQLFLASKWEHLKMPAMFEYTICVLTNYCNSGLLHGYLRHRTELEPHVPGLTELRDRLCDLFPTDALRVLLKLVDETETPSGADQKTLLEIWLDFLQTVPKRQQGAMITALDKIQILLSEFLLRVMTQENFSGETTFYGKKRIYFKINDTTSLVLGVSMQLYSGFLGRRPTRELITFFIDKNNRAKIVQIRTRYIKDS